MCKCMLYLKMTLKHETRQNKYILHYFFSTLAIKLCHLYQYILFFFAVNDERAEYTTLEGHIWRRR